MRRQVDAELGQFLFGNVAQVLEQVVLPGLAENEVITSRFVRAWPTGFHEAGDDLALTSRRPLRAMAAVLDAFRHRATPPMRGIDLPGWVADLSETRVSRVRCRTGGDHQTWLLEVLLPGGPRMVAAPMVEPTFGSIHRVTADDGGLRKLERRVARWAPSPKPFETVAPTAAADQLVEALGRHHTRPADIGAAWTGDEALVTWLISLLVRQANDEAQAA